VREQYNIGPGKEFTKEKLDQCCGGGVQLVKPDALEVKHGGTLHGKMKGRLSDEHKARLKELQAEGKAKRKAPVNDENQPPELLPGQQQMLACGRGLCKRAFTSEALRQMHMAGNACAGHERQEKQAKLRFNLADVGAAGCADMSTAEEVPTQPAKPDPPAWEKELLQVVDNVVSGSAIAMKPELNLYAAEGWAMVPRTNKKRAPEVLKACSLWAQNYHTEANRNNMRANEWSAARDMMDQFPDEPEMWLEPSTLKAMFTKLTKAANAKAGNDKHAAQPAAVAAARALEQEEEPEGEGWTEDEYNMAWLHAAVANQGD
jgi:hypothetical protein